MRCHLDFERPDRHFDSHQILNDPRGSIWRYERLLPVSAPPFQATPLHQVGCTPVYQPERLAKTLGMSRLWVKDESRNPSASFKDRASAVVIARALETGIGTIVAASTGNAGAATACMAASVGLPAIILAPRSAPPAKVAQLLAFGARVFLVEGTYDEAFDLSIQASDAFGWYNRNTGYNPFTVEGKKTAAFEIWEQLISTGKVNPAELTIYIPVGDGNIISGIAKGFKDLLRLGWIDQLPRLAGVQAEGSAAIARAFAAGTDQILPVQAQTIADSISVDLPRDGSRALKSVRESGGPLFNFARHSGTWQQWTVRRTRCRSSLGGVKTGLAGRTSGPSRARTGAVHWQRAERRPGCQRGGCTRAGDRADHLSFGGSYS